MRTILAILFLIPLTLMGQGYVRRVDSLSQLLAINPQIDATTGKLDVVVDQPTTNTSWGAPRVATWKKVSALATNVANTFNSPFGGQWLFWDRDNPIQDARWWGISTNIWSVDTSGNLKLGTTNVAGKLASIEASIPALPLNLAYTDLPNTFSSTNAFTGRLLSPWESGDNSFVAGEDAQAYGKRSIAIGVKANSFTNNRSIAIGYEAESYSYEGTSIGYFSSTGSDATSTSFATAIGYGTHAAADTSTAIGYSSYASGPASIAIGNGNSQADYSIAIGYGATSWDTNGIAIGAGALAPGDAVSIGRDAGMWTGASRSVSVGMGSGANNDSVAIGYGALATFHTNSVAIGAGSATSADHQIRLGTSAETVSIPGTLLVGTTNIITELAKKSDTNHVHDASVITSGYVSTARLGSGTANTNSFLRGDGQWAVVTTNGSAPTAGTNAVWVKSNYITNLIDGPNVSWTISGKEAYPYVPSGSSITNLTVPGYLTAGGTITAANLGSDAYAGPAYHLIVRDDSSYQMTVMSTNMALTYIDAAASRHGHSALTNLIIRTNLYVANDAFVTNNLLVTGIFANTITNASSMYVGGSLRVTNTVTANSMLANTSSIGQLTVTTNMFVDLISYFTNGIYSSVGSFVAPFGQMYASNVSAGTLVSMATEQSSFTPASLFLPIFTSDPTAVRETVHWTHPADFFNNTFYPLYRTNVAWVDLENKFTAKNTFGGWTYLTGMVMSPYLGVDSSTKIGFNAKAGPASIAIGNLADSYSAGGSGAIAIGSPASASTNSTSIGTSSSALVDYGTAIGYEAVDAAPRSTVIGYKASATVDAADSVAIGRLATATNNYSTAVGALTIAGQTATAIGASAVSPYVGGTAIGYQAITTGPYGQSVGGSAGSNSVAIGVFARSAIQSTAIGYGSDATNTTSVAIGVYARAKGASGLAVGQYANADYSGSTAVGYSAGATAIDQIRLGTSVNDVNVPGSVTIGTTNVVGALAGKAPLVHNHSASEITSGTMAQDRLGTGHVALGATKFLREDQTWVIPSVGSGGRLVYRPPGNYEAVTGDSVIIANFAATSTVTLPMGGVLADGNIVTVIRTGGTGNLKINVNGVDSGEHNTAMYMDTFMYLGSENVYILLYHQDGT